MKKIAPILVGALVLGACAQQPENIAAIETSANSYYSNMNCRQLAAEELSVTQNLENLSADQRRAANGDFWGVFWIGVPVSSMAGGDREGEIAVARGQLQAIDREQAARSCS